MHVKFSARLSFLVIVTCMSDYRWVLNW
jgi:hypothetical protein